MRRAYQWNSDLQDEGEKDWCCVNLRNISLWKTWSKGCRTEAHGRGNSISTHVFTELQDCDTKVFVLGMTMYDCHICIPIFKHSQSSNTQLSRDIYDYGQRLKLLSAPSTATMAETGGIQGVQRARGNWRDAFLHRRWGKHLWQFGVGLVGACKLWFYYKLILKLAQIFCFYTLKDLNPFLQILLLQEQ